MNPNLEPTELPIYLYAVWFFIGAAAGSMITWLVYEIKKDCKKVCNTHKKTS